MKKRLLLLVPASLMAGSASVWADVPNLGDVLTSTGIIATGHVSGSYEAGFNHGDTLAYHAFDSNANSFELNQAALTLAYQPTSGFGAVANFTAGSDAKVINSSYSGSSSGNDFALTQGFVQYATGNLTVIGGRYVTLAGAEVIDDSLDTNISRSFMFQLGEPLVHTGLRAAYKIGTAWTAYAGINNSAYSGNSEDVNKPKTGELGFAFSPSSKLALSATDYYGVDSSFKDNYLDGVATVQITDKLQFVLNGDYFRAYGNTDGIPVSTTVAGGAGYLNYQFTDKFKASLRGEYATTKNDVACPKDDGKCNLSEVTLTLGYMPAKNFMLLAEFRHDMSSDSVYPNPNYASVNEDGSFDTSQATDKQSELAIKAIFTFGNPPPPAS